MAGSMTGGLSFKDKTLEIKEESKNKQDFEFTSRTENEEIKNIRLKPEQIEEINTDDYSLLLFNVTRVEPLSLSQIKKHFPEPSAKKAQSVMDRFIDCGLVHITKDGKYYSNYPDHYIDYSLYRYDAILEAKKDSRVFDLMKENCNSKTYWKDKSYFSEDGFFTEEQSKEISEALNEVRLKVKKYTSENRKNKKVSELIFRRFKYYDMILGLLFLVGSLICSPANTAFAQGNDPGMPIANFQFQNSFPSKFDFNKFNVNPLSPEEVIDSIVNRDSIQMLMGGNDPGAALLQHSANQARFFRPRNSRLIEEMSVEYGIRVVEAAAYAVDPVSDSGGHDPGSSKSSTVEIMNINPYEAAVDCGEQLERAKGSLIGVSPFCLKVIMHSSVKECNETGDEAFCESAEKGAELSFKYGVSKDTE
ncbi:MAG: hypothetical protein ACRBBP_10865 [Bdellovibrionales bacterium]